jgi:hypothetical protein
VLASDLHVAGEVLAQGGAAAVVLDGGLETTMIFQRGLDLPQLVYLAGIGSYP